MSDIDSKLELNKAMVQTMSIASKFTQVDSPFGVAPYTILTIAQDPVRPEQANVYVKIDRFANYPPNFVRRLNPPDSVRYSFKNLKVRRYNLARVFKYLGFKQDPVTGHFSSPVNMDDYRQMDFSAFVVAVENQVVFMEDDIDVIGYKDNFLVRAKVDSLGFMGTAGFKRDGVSPAVPSPNVDPNAPVLPFAINQADRLGDAVTWNHTRTVTGMQFNDVSLVEGTMISHPPFQPSSNYNSSVPMGNSIMGFEENATGVYTADGTNTYFSLDMEGKYKAKYALIGSLVTLFIDGSKLTTKSNLQVTLTNGTFYSGPVDETTISTISTMLVTLYPNQRQMIPILVSADSLVTELKATISSLDVNRKPVSTSEVTLPVQYHPAKIVAFKVRAISLTTRSEAKTDNASSPVEIAFRIEDVLDSNGNVLSEIPYNFTNSTFTWTAVNAADQQNLQNPGGIWFFQGTNYKVGDQIAFDVVCADGPKVRITINVTSVESTTTPEVPDQPSVNYYVPTNLADQLDRNVQYDQTRLVQGVEFNDYSLVYSDAPETSRIQPSSEYNPKTPIYYGPSGANGFAEFIPMKNTAYFSFDMEGKYKASKVMPGSIVFLILDGTSLTESSALKISINNGGIYERDFQNNNQGNPSKGTVTSEIEIPLTKGRRQLLQVKVTGITGTTPISLSAAISYQLNSDDYSSPVTTDQVPIVDSGSQAAIQSFIVRTLDLTKNVEITDKTLSMPVSAIVVVDDILDTNLNILSSSGVGANPDYFTVTATIKGVDTILNSFGTGWSLSSSDAVDGDKIPLTVKSVNGFVVHTELTVSSDASNLEPTEPTEPTTVDGSAMTWRFDDYQYTDKAIVGSGGNVVYPPIDSRFDNRYPTYPAGSTFTEFSDEPSILTAKSGLDIYWSSDMDGKYLASTVPDMSTIFLVLDNSQTAEPFVLSVLTNETAGTINGKQFDLSKVNVPAAVRVVIPFYVTFADRTISSDIVASVRSSSVAGNGVVTSNTATLTSGLDRSIVSFNAHPFDLSRTIDSKQPDINGNYHSVNGETASVYGPLNVAIRLSDLHAKFSGMVSGIEDISKFKFDVPGSIENKPIKTVVDGNLLRITSDGPTNLSTMLNVAITCSDIPSKPANVALKVLVDDAVRDASTKLQVSSPVEPDLFPMERSYGYLQLNDKFFMGSMGSNSTGENLIRKPVSNYYTHTLSFWNYPYTHGEMTDGVKVSTFDPITMTIPTYWAADPEGRIDITETVDGLIAYLVFDLTQSTSNDDFNLTVDLRNGLFIDPKSTNRAIPGGTNYSTTNTYLGDYTVSALTKKQLGTVDRSKDVLSSGSTTTSKIIQVRSGYRTIVPVKVHVDTSDSSKTIVMQNQLVYATIYDMGSSAANSFKTASLSMPDYSYSAGISRIDSFRLRAVDGTLNHELARDAAFSHKIAIHVEQIFDSSSRVVDWRSVQELNPDWIQYAISMDNGTQYDDDFDSIELTDYGFMINVKSTTTAKQLMFTLSIDHAKQNFTLDVTSEANIPT